ncbi:MAG TPA: sulfatase-like hydrolase/transferase, partial [Polyangiaceae bacterium]|nr:sulfatase-like hydrolase/transferase [Polyangiaceae bacterium]
MRARRLFRIARIGLLRPDRLIMAESLRASLPTLVRFLKSRTVRAKLRTLVRTARRTRRSAVAIGLTPPGLGAFFVLALVLWGLSEPLVSDHERVLGDDTSKANAWVTVRYARDILFIQCELAAIAIAFGAVLGWIAGGLVQAASWATGRGNVSRLGLALWSLGLIVLLQGGLGAWSMAHDPQFYADAWYARGGAWRAIQETISDRLGPAKIAVVAGLLVVAYLCGVVACARRRCANVQLTNREVATRSRIAAVPFLLAAVLLVVELPLCHATRCGDAHARHFDRTGRHPNLLILAADSLRNDHVDAVLTPHLAEVAARGTRFTRAYVSQARTFPSWTTILTGLYPHHHSIRNDFPRWEERTRSFDTIASRFARAGYATHVVSDYGGDIFNLVDFGFEDVRAPRVDFRQYIRLKGLERARALLPILHTRFGRAIEPAMWEAPRGASADLVADDAIAALGADDARPFFMVIFFSAPHYPYASPAPYFRRFAVRDYEGLYKYYKPVWYADSDPDPLDVAQIRGLYKGAVASVDDAAGRILRELSARGEDEHTIVAVLSDHGE